MPFQGSSSPGANPTGARSGKGARDGTALECRIPQGGTPLVRVKGRNSLKAEFKEAAIEPLCAVTSAEQMYNRALRLAFLFWAALGVI